MRSFRGCRYPNGRGRRNNDSSDMVELTSEEDLKKINRTLDLLDMDDDVQAVYHNWDTDER